MALPATEPALTPVCRAELDDPAERVAPRLLGRWLVAGARAVRIVEVEAYGGADDPASHAFGGRTRRNASMFGAPGALYVYRSYGVHWCANVVCDAEDHPSAVLLRAGAPVAGVEAMRVARGGRRDRELCSGPGRLCQALGIDGSHDGVDLLDAASPVRLVAGDGPPVDIVAAPRVGISRATDRPWRWYLAGEPHVSGRRRPAPPRPLEKQ